MHNGNCCMSQAQTNLSPFSSLSQAWACLSRSDSEAPPRAHDISEHLSPQIRPTVAQNTVIEAQSLPNFHGVFFVCFFSPSPSNLNPYYDLFIIVFHCRWKSIICMTSWVNGKQRRGVCQDLCASFASKNKITPTTKATKKGERTPSFVVSIISKRCKFGKLFLPLFGGCEHLWRCETFVLYLTTFL